MKHIRKILGTILVIAMVCSLAACGSSNSNVENTDEGKVWYLGRDVSSKDFSDIQDTLDAAEMYRTIKYDEKMLGGRYELYNKEKDFDSFKKDMEYEEIEYAQSFLDESRTEKAVVSLLPVSIEAGPSALTNSGSGGASDLVRMDRTHDWAVLTFIEEDAKSVHDHIQVVCSFTVEGNKVIYKPLDYYQKVKDENYKTTEVKITISEKAFEYDFSFRGPYLTLSKGNHSVTLCSFEFSANTGNGPSIQGYATLSTPKIDGITNLSGSSTIAFAHTENEKENSIGLDNFSMKITENGLITLRWTVKDDNDVESVVTRQFIYFDNYYGLVLVDKNNTYYYHESSQSLKYASISEGLSIVDAAAVAELSESELNTIIEKKENLIEDLAAAFEAAGIKVTVNETTGELAMDASVLFGGDSAVLTGAGKDFLNKFIGAYTNIVFNDKYKGFVSKTKIEGHTAPVSGSTYESGLPLSEERANAVKNYCLSAESGVNSEYIAELASTMEAVGMSNATPVYDQNGNVDMAASRRVSFRFIINIG